MKMLYIKHRSGKRMNNFALSAILAAKDLGIDFTIANNMSMADKGHFEQICDQYGIKMVHIDFDRNPLGKSNLAAGRQLLELMKKEKYDVVHCNTPSGGLVGRVCAAKAGIPKVIYMAHGFHFWKGAPIKNWLFYYPVEKILAHYTDILITMNQEDFSRARSFKLKKGGKAVYVPGVGIDAEKVRNTPCNREEKRHELHIKTDAIVYTAVGELIPRKGYIPLIKAFIKENTDQAVLLICGTGSQENELKELVKNEKAEEKVLFPGFRTDVYEILKASDVFVFASRQEGLPVALMEAMAADLPCVASSVRGNVDLLKNSRLLFKPGDETGLRKALKDAINPSVRENEICQNRETLKHFTIDKAVSAMKEIYLSLTE